jgi:hypothetical protein
MRNGPDTKITLDLPLQSDVRVWREKDGWQGPYKLLATEGETCTINMPYRPTKFRSTVVKPYLTEETTEMLEGQTVHEENDETVRREPDETVQRGPRRPRGSRNTKRSENQPTH